MKSLMVEYFPGTINRHVRYKFKSALLFFWCCALWISGLCASAAGALPRIDKLLPPETVFFVNVDDFQQLKTKFEKTGFYRLYKDPAMTDFMESTTEKWREKIQKLDDNDIFKAIFNAEVLPEGKVGIALVLNQENKDFNEPPVVIITQWGQGVDKLKESIDKMLEKNIELGGHQKRREDYRGVSIEITVDESSSVLNHCFIDDCFITSGNLELLKFVIAQIKGSSSEVLADDADYNSVMKTVGAYRDVELYVNIKQIIKAAIAKDSSGEVQNMTVNLGFDNISAFGCSVSVADSAGSSASAKGFLKINGAKKGICKMLEAESAFFKVPAFIPSSTYSITFFNLNIRKAYDELYNILYRFNPQYVAMLRAMDLPESPGGEPGLKLKDDIINHFGSQIIISQSVNKPFSENAVPTESLVALAVSNRGAIEKSLSLLHDKMIAQNNPDARRELLGHTIYLLGLGPSALPFLRPGATPMQVTPGTGAAQMPRPAFTVTNTHLILSSETVVEQAIRSLSSNNVSSLASAKWFRSAKSAIPSVVGLGALENNLASSEIFWWMVKESGKGGASGGPPVMIFASPEVSELFNFNLLPQFEAVHQYFGMSAFYGISTPEGFLFEFKDIRPTVASN